MHDFVRNLITEWRALGANGPDAVLIGLSGGADSVALLCAFAQLKSDGKLENELAAAHFNHRLRGDESDGDEEFSRILAGSLQLEFHTGEPGDSEIRGNTEQSARRARYSFLLRTALENGASKVVTAHTINDQAETFLANLIRGSGPDGLSAMAVERELGGSKVVTLVRPLLHWATREMTEEYCAHLGVEFRNDSMNVDPAFNRVRFRNELIPMLQQFNPSIIETLARTAGSMRDVRNVVDRLMSENTGIAELVNAPFLPVGKLKELPHELMQMTIRSWVRKQKGDLKGVSSAHLKGIAALVGSVKSGKIVELPGGKVVVKGSGKLELKDREVDKSRFGVYN